MTTSNSIDIAIGQVLGHLLDSRGGEVEAAASAAGMTLREVQQVIQGSRRLRASEMFALSQRLDVPVAVFYVGVGRSCEGEAARGGTED